MTDAAFREALDAAFDRYGDWRTYKGTRGEVYQDFQTARARVLALYDEIVAERDDLMAIAIGDKVRKPSNPSLAERQGEVYEVAFIQPDCGDPTVPEYRAEWGMVLHGTMPVWLHPDQRVRVSRIPAGDMTGEAP